MQYIVAAENSQYMNIKFLEYYHVLEYFFLDAQIAKVDKAVEQLLEKRILGEKQTNETKSISHRLLNELLNSGNNNELNQFIAIFESKISAMHLIEILNVLNVDLSFLYNPVFGGSEGGIAINQIHTKNSKQINRTATEAQVKEIFAPLCKRIYSIRNYIVHTKHGERDKVFLPNKEFQEGLVNDVRLIREIAFRLMFCQ